MVATKLPGFGKLFIVAVDAWLLACAELLGKMMASTKLAVIVMILAILSVLTFSF